MKLIRWIVLLLLTLALVPAQTKQTSSPKASTSSTKLIDLNSASREEIESLPGIGKVYSQKIINGRPYTNKRQLVSKGIIPQATYDKLSALVIARQKK
jgi:competence protein ComEA